MCNSVEFIQKLNMKPHPEGGYYVQMFESASEVGNIDASGNTINKRAAITSIYFLLSSGQVSKFHRLKSDEIWYFHDGVSLNIHIIDQTGKYSMKKLGSDFSNGDCFQHVVKAGSWFGAEITSESRNCFALVSCAVAPGFLFEEFELAKRQELLVQFPQYTKIIKTLT